MGIALSDSAQALERLFARTTGASRLGLERTTALLELLGNPHQAFGSFHVAGTNGKGSTVATIDALLRDPGRKVGRYTSPHLVDFRERIAVDGALIPDEAVVEFLDRHMGDIERTGATFFEATTVMAFDWFARAAVDVAVIETGLGGRLDATNVITPLVATVTSIGVDHVEFLGMTTGEIAAEKAGIFKPGTPAVIGEPDPAIREMLLAHAARARASSVSSVDRDWAVTDVGVTAAGTTFTLRLGAQEVHCVSPLVGAHQAWNAGAAIASVAAAGVPWFQSPKHAAEALARVRLAGRFERRGPFIFDVAHNPDGAAVLARTLAATMPARPLVALLTVLRDKDWKGIMTQLATVVDGFILTSAPTAPASRSWDPREALRASEEEGWVAEVVDDFDEALRVAAARGATVVVTGSFHTVGDAMARLRVSPLAR